MCPFSLNKILVVTILLLLSRVLTARLGLSPLAKDLWLVRTSIVSLVFETFGIGLISTSTTLIISLMVYALGCGYGPTMQSLLTMVAGGRHVGMLFMAFWIAGPLMAATIQLGMALDWLAVYFRCRNYSS